VLTISTLDEALEWLSTATGRAWTQAEFFDLATSQHVDLHAVAPDSSEISLQEFVIGDGLTEKFRLPAGHSLFALLKPFQVGEIWQRGETKTSFPSDYEQGDSQWKFFTAPVTVTANMVRVKTEALKKLQRAWEQAQSGELPKHQGPAWLFTEAVKLTEKEGRKVPAPASAAGQEEPNKEVMWSYLDAIDAVSELVSQDPLALYLCEWLTKETKEQKKLSRKLTLGGLDFPIGTDLYVRLQAVQGSAEKLARLVDGNSQPRTSYQIQICDRLEAKHPATKQAEPESPSVGQVRDSGAAVALPEGLSTSALACAFNGIYWDILHWAKNLKDCPAWLKEDARMSRGKRGGNNPLQSTWNPVLVGKYLVLDCNGWKRSNETTFEQRVNMLTERFRSNDDLKHWKPLWGAEAAELLGGD
jgi:hypothetical protein